MKKLQKLLSLSVLAIAVTACGPGGNGLTAKQIQDAIEKPIHTYHEVHVDVEKWNSTTTGTLTYIIDSETEIITDKLHSVNPETPSITSTNEDGENTKLLFHKDGLNHSVVGPAELIRNIYNSGPYPIFGRWAVNGETLVKWGAHSGYKRLPNKTEEQVEEMFIELGIEKYDFSEINLDFAKRLVIGKIWTNAGGKLEKLPLNASSAYAQLPNHKAWDINLEEEILSQE